MTPTLATQFLSFPKNFPGKGSKIILFSPPISFVSRQKSFREVSSTGASMTSAMSSSNDYYGGESDVMLKVNNDPNPAMDTSVHSVTFSDIDLNDD